MKEQITEKKRFGYGNRLFPRNIRTVEDVVREGREVAENWPTEVIYMQDDVHGFNLEWLKNLGDHWPTEVGIPYHAQMRWEMTEDVRRLDLIKRAGCFGLTLAIEAADPHIRKEVLHRDMEEKLMYNGMKEIINRGLRVRTEQITGLPYGATTKPTTMNLDADLQLVELNVDLRRTTGGPTMAWASTLAPYNGTELGIYCKTYGHHERDDDDVPDTFFDRSVLRFPKEWVGQKLKDLKNHDFVWLSPDDLETYRDKNAELRRHFNFFAIVPEGHKLARSYLTKKEPFSYERLGKETEEHLRAIAPTDQEARMILEKMNIVSQQVSRNGYNEELHSLVPYFACLPRGELVIERALNYAEQKGGFTPKVLSTAVRHHFYENILYATDDFYMDAFYSDGNAPVLSRFRHSGESAERMVVNERYSAKV